jgi:hypothetical protein
VHEGIEIQVAKEFDADFFLAELEVCVVGLLFEVSVDGHAVVINAKPAEIFVSD